VVQKVFDAGEALGFLKLSVLEIIISQITDAPVIRRDLLPPVHFLFAHRPAPLEPEIVAPGIGFVCRHIRVDLKTVELAAPAPCRNAA